MFCFFFSGPLTGIIGMVVGMLGNSRLWAEIEKLMRSVYFVFSLESCLNIIEPY